MYLVRFWKILNDITQKNLIIMKQNIFSNNILIVVVTIILFLLYQSLLNNHSNYFDEIDEKLSKGETVVLNKDSHEVKS